MKKFLNKISRFFSIRRKSPLLIGQWKMIDFTVNGKVPEDNIIDEYILTILRKGKGFGNLDNDFDQNFEWTLDGDKFGFIVNEGIRYFDVILLTEDYFIYQIQQSYMNDSNKVVEATLITTYKKI